MVDLTRTVEILGLMVCEMPTGMPHRKLCSIGSSVNHGWHDNRGVCFSWLYWSSGGDWGQRFPVSKSCIAPVRLLPAATDKSEVLKRLCSSVLRASHSWLHTCTLPCRGVVHNRLCFLVRCSAQAVCASWLWFHLGGGHDAKRSSSFVPYPQSFQSWDCGVSGPRRCLSVFTRNPDTDIFNFVIPEWESRSC